MVGAHHPRFLPRSTDSRRPCAIPMQRVNAPVVLEWTVLDVDYRVDAVTVRARTWEQALDVGAEMLGVPRERLVLVPKGQAE